MRATLAVSARCFFRGPTSKVPSGAKRALNRRTAVNPGFTKNDRLLERLEHAGHDAFGETTTTDVAEEVVHALLNPGLVSIVSNPNQEQVRGGSVVGHRPRRSQRCLQPAAGPGVHGRRCEEGGDVRNLGTGR